MHLFRDPRKERQTDSQSDSQKDRQTDRQTDRDRDRERKRKLPSEMGQGNHHLPATQTKIAGDGNY